MPYNGIWSVLRDVPGKTDRRPFRQIVGRDPRPNVEVRLVVVFVARRKAPRTTSVIQARP